jgi:hypothetical protein
MFGLLLGNLRELSFRAYEKCTLMKELDMKTKLIASALVIATLATGCENPKQAVGTLGGGALGAWAGLQLKRSWQVVAAVERLRSPAGAISSWIKLIKPKRKTSTGS